MTLSEEELVAFHFDDLPADRAAEIRSLAQQDEELAFDLYLAAVSVSLVGGVHHGRTSSDADREVENSRPGTYRLKRRPWGVKAWSLIAVGTAAALLLVAGPFFWPSDFWTSDELLIDVVASGQLAGTESSEVKHVEAEVYRVTEGSDYKFVFQSRHTLFVLVIEPKRLMLLPRGQPHSIRVLPDQTVEDGPYFATTNAATWLVLVTDRDVRSAIERFLDNQEPGDRDLVERLTRAARDAGSSKVQVKQIEILPLTQ